MLNYNIFYNYTFYKSKQFVSNCEKKKVYLNYESCSKCKKFLIFRKICHPEIPALQFEDKLKK